MIKIKTTAGKLTVFGNLLHKTLKLILQLIYDKKYFEGEYFKYNFTGYRWVLKSFIFQKLFRINAHIPFPCSFRTTISNHKNLFFNINDLNNFQSPGCYFQNFSANIYLGEGTYIAPNVGIITANHDINDLNKHLEGKDVVIGKKCWIGMNAVILPGVVLGDNTIVGAGAVVTKSFNEGNIVIAGNPAKVIKTIKKLI